jgi:hypothetical protein
MDVGIYLPETVIYSIISKEIGQGLEAIARMQQR